MKSRSLMARVVGLVLGLGLLASAAWGADYFLSPDGNDAGSGAKDQPWRGLDKANAVLREGDTVTLAPGEYDGVIEPRNNGGKGRPIVYRSERPLGAVLRGVPDKPTLSLAGRQHIVLDGFHVCPRKGRWADIRDCEGIVVRNCRMEENRVGYSAFHVEGCKNTRILGNVFTRQLLMARNVGLSGDMLVITKCDRTVVEGNDFSKVSHGPACWLVTTNDVIRRNVFHHAWGRTCGGLFNCTPVLFEENVFMDTYHGSGSADSGSKILTIDGIVRRNLAVRNGDYVIHSGNYKYESYPPWVLTGTRIYHNTFAQNASFAWWLCAMTGDPNAISRNVWKNNLFSGHTPWGGSRTIYISGPIAEDNLWTRNLICGDRPGAQTIWQFDAQTKKILPYSLAEAEKQFPKRFQSNLDLPPEFVDPANDDYALRPNSPAIDRGDSLTVTTEAGSGQAVKVADARWFYDGFGIEGEQGDWVMVGPAKQIARVVGADRSQNILTLDRPVSWGKGDGVSLPYAGSAPDLGATEFGAEKEPWFRAPSVPKDLRVRPAVDPKAPLVATDFEDENIEEWGYRWYWNWRAHVLSERVSDTAARGKHSVRLFAEKDGVLLDASIAPRDWDVDRYPTVRFSYRLQPGVPVGLRFETFPAGVTSGDQWVYVGGSPTFLAAVKPPIERYRLADDDQWHSITLDARAVRETFKEAKVLYAFRLYSSVRLKQGQQCWVDDFAILPAGQ